MQTEEVAQKNDKKYLEVLSNIGSAVNNMNQEGEAASRRERFGHRRKGTGRVTQTGKFELVGRRTGFVVKENVRKGADGFEDIDDFWGDTPKPVAQNKDNSKTQKPAAQQDSQPSPVAVKDKPATSPSPTPPATTAAGTPEDAVREEPPEPESSIKKKRLDFSDQVADDGFDDDDDDFVAGGVGGGGFSDDDDEEYRESPAPASKSSTGRRKRGRPRKTVNSDDDDDDSVASSAVKPKRSTRRGKSGKAKRVIYKDMSDEELDKFQTKTPKITTNRNNKGRRVKKVIPPAAVPEETGATPGVRRSKRRRWKPLQHWKGERLVLQQNGESDVVAEVVAAERPELFMSPLESKVIRRRPKMKKRKPKTETGANVEPVKVEFVPDPADTKIECFDVVTGELEEKEVVRLATELSFKKLPAEIVEKDENGNPQHGPRPAADAAASFDDTQLISGVMELAPEAAKAREKTHRCTQVFMITEAQDKSVEVGIESNTFLLSSGDHFLVPAHTTYNVVNHSKSEVAKLVFTLVKPFKKHAVPTPVKA